LWGRHFDIKSWENTTHAKWSGKQNSHEKNLGVSSSKKERVDQGFFCPKKYKNMKFQNKITIVFSMVLLVCLQKKEENIGSEVKRRSSHLAAISDAFSSSETPVLDDEGMQKRNH
jgi:hypothetical protein